MNLLVSAIVQIVVGIAEKCTPTVVAWWTKRQADKELAEQLKSNLEAVKAANQPPPPVP